MTRYSGQPRDQIFVKSYEFLFFAKNMDKNIGKNISKTFNRKYRPGMLATCQKLLDHAKQSSTDAFKTLSKSLIQKAAEPIGDLICNKIANKFTKLPRNLRWNNSGTFTNEHDKEIPKEKYISSEKRQ